ncbi:MAG: fused MFS/spermidine synthase [Chloroflexi bacterium]|nr:fused MFS/spermidine synthase [Chloroflexota bacterium]
MQVNNKIPFRVETVYGWFFFSGMAALIYQVVWARQLELIFGSTLFAVSAILSAFMAGLALGSFYIGKLADRRGKPLTVYILLEVGIGVYAVLTPYLFKILPFLEKNIPQIYSSGGLSFSLVSVVFSFVVLIVPTFLMGGTLPTATRFIVGNYSELGKRIGRLYFINTLGAAAGASLAGFILIAAFGLVLTTVIAAMFNWLIAFTAFLMLRSINRSHMPEIAPFTHPENDPPAPPSDLETPTPARQHVILLIGYGLAGFAALGLEVLWTRTLIMFIGSTVYAFSLMLMAILSGIALGSLLMAPRTDVNRHRLLIYFAAIEVALGISVIAITPLLGQYPLVFLKLFMEYEDSFWLLQILEFGLVFVTLLVPTTLMGAAFPVISKLYASDLKRLGQRIGDIYAVNTFGCVLGPLAMSFLLIPLVGIQKSIGIAAVIYLFVGFMVLSLSPRIRPRGKAVTGLVLAAIMVTGIALPQWTKEMISSGVYFHGQSYASAGGLEEAKAVMLQRKIIFYKEGQLATVAVFDHPTGSRVLTINGKVDASSIADMGTQLYVAHMPMLLHPDPKKALMIGIGSGSTLGAMSLHPEVERIDAVEIEPAVIEAAKYMKEMNHDVVNNPRVRMLAGDGRNFILNSPEKYDVIVTQPSNMWVSSSSNLFSKEVFELYKGRLAENGIVGQWMYVYRIDEDDLKTMINTFRSVFPNTIIWGNYFYPDILLIGSLKPLEIDYANFSARVLREPVKSDLGRIQADDPMTMLSYFQMDEAAVAGYTAGASINTDDRPRLEFSAPKNMYLATTEVNLEGMKPYQSNLAPRLKNVGDRAIMERVEKSYQAKRHIIDGVILMAQGETADAATAWEAALEQDPDDRTVKRQLADTYLSIGKWFYDSGSYEDAFRYYRRVAELQPPNAQTYLYLGLVSNSLGRKDDGAKYLDMALKVKPGDATIHYEIGHGFLSSRQLDEAVTHFTEAVRLDPRLFTALASRGYAWHELGKYDQALSDYNEVLRLDPGFLRIYLDRARAYYEKGDYAKALADLDHLLGKQDMAGAYDLRSLILIHQKEYDRALRDSQKASTMDPLMPLPYYRRGAIYQGLGKKAEAIDAYERFLLFPVDEGLKESARQELAKLKK